MSGCGIGIKSGYIFLVFTLNILSAVLCMPVYGQQRRINLSECIETALQNNSDILETDEDWKKSMADYRVARSQRGLRVDGQLKTVERLKDSSPSDENIRIPGRDTNIGLFAGLYSYYYLYDAQRKQSELAAKARLYITRIESEKIREDVIFNVKKSYYDYLLAIDNLELRKKLLDKAGEKQKLVKNLYDNGLQPALDVMQAEVSYSKALLNFEKAVNTERTMRGAFYIAIGVEEIENADIAPVEKERLPCLKYSAEELNKLALFYCPDLKLFEERRKIAKLNIEVARAANKPSVYLSIGLGLENEGLYLFVNDEGSFGDNFKPKNWGPVFTTAITASIPVFYSGGLTAKIDGAIAEYNSLMYQERSVKIKIRNSIEDKYASLEELKKQIDISKLIVKNSRKHELLARRSYENGAGSLLDLQSSEEGVLSAEIGYMDVIYQYYITLASLSNILGVEEDEICQK